MTSMTKEIAQVKPLEEILKRNAAELLQAQWQQTEAWGQHWLALSESFFVQLSQDPSDINKIKALAEHIAYRKKLAHFLQEQNETLAGLRNFTFSAQLAHEIHDYLTLVPEIVKEDQHPDRFRRLPGDGLSIRFLKTLKRTGLFFTSLPAHMGNVFRKILRIQTRSPRVWTQKIPLRKLLDWYYHVHGLKQFSALLDQNHKRATLLIHEFWLWDNRVYEHLRHFLAEGNDPSSFQKGWQQEYLPLLRKLIANARDQQNDALQELEALIKNTRQTFLLQYMLAGTVEFSGWRHHEINRKRQLHRNQRIIREIVIRRINTLEAMADDWAFNQEIYILSQFVRKTSLLLHTRLMSKKDILEKKLDQIFPVLMEVKQEIRFTDQPEEFRKQLEKTRQKALKVLQASLLSEWINLLMEQNYPLLLDEAQQSFKQELNKLKNERILITGFDPSKAYSYRALQKISPRTIIEFEMAVLLEKSFLKAKTYSLDHLEKMRLEMEDLGRMVVYNIDTAIALWDQQGERAQEDCLLDAHESMQRAAENLQAIRMNFGTFSETLSLQIGTAGQDFSQQLLTLTDNRNVELIRFRIAKVRAINQGGYLLNLGQQWTQRSWRRSAAFYRLTSSNIKSGIGKLRGRLGLQGLDQQITSHISEFLLADQGNLPFVYKRLFQIEPLRDPTFYFERTQEKSMLMNAWQKWQKGVFTPVLIIGEKGSGVSTFINLFVREHMQRSPHVFSIAPARRVMTEEDLLHLLGISIRGQAFDKVADFYDFVEKQSPFVVFVDKLHLMYLRLPGGFSTLKKFFELISQTSKKIFWICTCGKYASLYLDNSVGLYSYFPAVILMQKLQIQEVRKVITLRHKTSGYSLQCIPGRMDLHDKNFLKKSEDQKQAFLLDRYFTALNRLTESNIAFALQLWLRSTKKSDENIIFLYSLEDIDFGFMYNLPEEIVFGLHALLLHENLDVFQLSQVLNTSKRQAWLMLMRLADRGMVCEDKGFYTVHPLLYRQTISLLKDRNLIH